VAIPVGDDGEDVARVLQSVFGLHPLTTSDLTEADAVAKLELFTEPSSYTFIVRVFSSVSKTTNPSDMCAGLA
jgi:Mg2+ and Co2+ transporter CorA